MQNDFFPEKEQLLYDLTLRLEHLKMRSKPEEILSALHFYTRGYRTFLELIGGQILPGEEPIFCLEYVEKGSIKLKNKTGYKPGIINFIGYQIAKLLSSDLTNDDLHNKAAELETETAEFIKNSHLKNEMIRRAEPFVDPITLAEIAADFSEAGQLLQPEEHFEILISETNDDKSNIIQFDRNFRSHVNMAELKKDIPIKFDDIDKFVVIQPCNIGNKAWYVQSILSKRKYMVKIKDLEWLQKYQSGNIGVVHANDIVSANVVCDVFTKKSGKSYNQNAYAAKVISIEKSRSLVAENQTNLFE